MESLNNLLYGFSIALLPSNLLFAFIGCFMGTLVGVLPGLGPTASIAILIPLTFSMDPASAIIMLAAIFYGSMYGGTITTILLNIPGEAASAITALDGYEMAKRGRAGAALSIAAIGSFVGGIFATAGLVVGSIFLTRLALRFGPPEFFALMILGLSLITGLAGKSVCKALLMAVLGLILGTVGMDNTSGAMRFTYGQLDLFAGIPFVPAIMGLMGISEIFLALEGSSKPPSGSGDFSLMPTRQEFKDSAMPIVRGTGIGFALGLIPGMNTVVASVLSYSAERSLSKHPERFGNGAIEGVAGPEAANNSFANSALIPLFTLGIPGSPAVAVLLGAFTMNGLIPGPFLFKEHPEVVWPVIASFVVGNVILLILNLPMIKIWVSMLRIPYTILVVCIMVFMVLGAYTMNNSAYGIGVMIVFGIMGYLFKKLDMPLAPLVLTLILGPLVENTLRQSLQMSQGDLSIFLTRPISLTLLIISGLILLSFCFKFFKSDSVVGDGEV